MRVAYNLKDLIGQRFDHLLVISRIPNNYKNGKTIRAKWLCRCDCGIEKEFIGFCLLRPTLCGKSCGCLKYVTRTLPPGVGGRNKVLSGYKRGAEIRKLSWNLTEEQFDSLISGNCEYCGAEPSSKSIRRQTSRVAQFIYSGIDRVDNTRGYEPDNVVTCCRICNKAKDVMSAEQFVKWAIRVSNHAGKRDGFF